MDERETLQSSFSWNGTVKLLIEFDNSEGLTGVDIGVRVKDRRGITVFVSSMAHSMRSELPAIRGILGLEFPSQFLMPGTYTISVNAHIPTARLLSSAEDALQFTHEETGSPFTRHSGADIGLVVADCAWSLHNESYV